MRQIKFRAWHTLENKMFTPFDLHETLTYPPEGSWNTACIFLQFTGLTDKNGKDIYEGDIVKCHDHPTEVESGTYEIYFEHGHYKCRGSMDALHDFGTVWTEVIGNVYEHPDLLTRINPTT